MEYKEISRNKGIESLVKSWIIVPTKTDEYIPIDVFTYRENRFRTYMERLGNELTVYFHLKEGMSFNNSEVPEKIFLYGAYKENEKVCIVRTYGKVSALEKGGIYKQFIEDRLRLNRDNFDRLPIRPDIHQVVSVLKDINSGTFYKFCPEKFEHPDDQ